MPSWYVHIQAAAETMERLKAGVPAGSPLTQAQANDLFTAAHDNRNYLAAGALGPDLFFLLPDFKGDAGKGLLALIEFVLTTWKALDENFVEQWERGCPRCWTTRTSSPTTSRAGCSARSARC